MTYLLKFLGYVIGNFPFYKKVSLIILYQNVSKLLSCNAKIHQCSQYITVGNCICKFRISRCNFNTFNRITPFIIKSIRKKSCYLTLCIKTAAR